MRTLPIGERTVTAVGCGDVRLETAAARGVDAREVERAVSYALERGVTFIDAADEEAAERLCGDAVRALRLRDRATIACRVPPVAPRPGAPARDVLPERLPAAYVQQRIEASLRATRLDVLPLVWLPLQAAWRASSAWPDLAGACARLVREGKVMHWGAFVDAELGDEPWLAALAVPYSLLERPSFESKLPLVARRPLAGGVLAGVIGPGVRLAPRDDRRAPDGSLDEAALERSAIAAAKLAPLVEHVPPAARSCDAARALVERGRRPPHVEALTAAELALRYVIDRGAIALPRLHHREHIDEAIIAATAPPISSTLRDRLDELFRSEPSNI